MATLHDQIGVHWADLKAHHIKLLDGPTAARAKKYLTDRKAVLDVGLEQKPKVRSKVISDHMDAADEVFTTGRKRRPKRRTMWPR